LTPELFAKTRFLGILAVFRLYFGQISFHLVENAFATRQLAVLASSIAFYDIVLGQKENLTYVLRLSTFEFFFFAFLFFLLFFSFCYSD